MWWTVALGFLGKVKWYVWVIGALSATNLFTYEMWQHDSHALKNEKAAHVQDINNFKAAQATANAVAEATRTTLITESKANAAKADANYASLLTQYRASLLRYRTDTGSGSQADHNQLPATEGSNGPSPSPQLPETLTISGADADICAVNTARLVAVHDWAISLPRQP